ncbi:hypothetical protein [Chryseobacterium sp. SIMBA_029]|uniref:ATP-binding protein n=1 Tax=Chryseobacterium sp. SIMBA_029 TaxID=3085772 RepID=UPI00397B44D5
MKKLYFLLIIINLLHSCHKKNLQQESNRFYEKAFTFLEEKNEDSAYVNFDKAKEIFVESKNKIKEGKCLIQMAIISTNKGDYYSGQSLSTQAIKCLNENDKDQFSDIYSNYNNLGISSDNLKDYENAIKFNKLALKFAIEKSERLISLNNLSSVYRENKQYDQAIKIYKNILINSKIENNKIYPTALTNLAVSKWSENPNYDPQPELLKALKIRENENDLWGQNSSQSHLSDYFKNKNSEKALFHAIKMYEISKKLKSPDDQLEALKKIIELDTYNYKKFFDRYTTLRDSLQIERNNSKNQFALIKFDTEQIKKQNAQNENHILTQSIALGILVGVLVVLILIIMWYKKRQKGLQQEKELEVKNTQLKMSKKVHDVVANGIYQVMTKIENQEDFSKDEALDELEFVYEKSRDISYDKEDATEEEDFSEKISTSIGSFNNDSVKTYIAGNEKNIWKNVSQPKQDEIYQIIRELLVNMKKHSQASIVSFRFERMNNEIIIYYKDNGIGISGAVMHKNGLTNMVSRIEILKGQIIFDTETEKGLKINISFPVY